MLDQLMYYKEDKKGQILEEGINGVAPYRRGLPAPYANHA
jgi:pyruvate dehydrogenase complex dehydrogenase (E1) component